VHAVLAAFDQRNQVVGEPPSPIALAGFLAGRWQVSELLGQWPIDALLGIRCLGAVL